MYFVYFKISTIWCLICQHAFLRTRSNWTDTSVLNAIRDQLYDTGSHLLYNWVGLIELNWIHIPLWGIASTIKCRGFELICTSKLKDNCQPIERNWQSAPQILDPAWIKCGNHLKRPLKKPKLTHFLKVPIFKLHFWKQQPSVCTQAWNIIFCGQPSFVVQKEGELVVRLHMVNRLDLQLYHIATWAVLKESNWNMTWAQR